ncbi:MAG TPA: hypothetical protein VMV49_18450 [Candidatus Deferrimicrobium sp.]|nr:hypothetical protein [Candidatus Deferrimicrobium sp.]
MAIRWGLGITASLTIVFLIFGIILPWIQEYSFYLYISLLLITVVGIFAAFSFQLKSLKRITALIFAIASVSNIFWFCIAAYPLSIYFFSCNLCYIFIYALFFELLIYYSLKYQEKFEHTAIKGYHIHENTYGLLFIFLGFLSFFIGQWPIKSDLFFFFKYHVLLFFGTALLILGAFLIGRDYKDLKKLKFVEKLETRRIDPNFNSRKKYYHIGPTGLILVLFGICFLFQHKLLGSFFSSTFFVILGVFLILLGAIFGGINPTFFIKKINGFEKI